MNHSLTKRVLAMLLAVVLVIGAVPMAGFAAESEQEGTSAAVQEVTLNSETETAADDGTEESAMLTVKAAGDYDTSVSSGYFNVISSDTYNLAPGAIEKEIILNNADGSDRKVVHVFEVDAANESIEVVPGYYQIDKLDPNNLSDSTYWSAQQLTKTVAYYEDTLGYNVVGAMNTALAYDSNAPYDFMVWEGVVLADPANHSGNAQTYLAVYQDGSSELRSRTEALDGNEWTVVSANFGWLVKDGALVTTSVERTSSDASRSMIGIKADGTLVFCQVDGRNAPISTGLSNYEMGEMMLALGCVNAVNCDGGGSSTFVSKREGTTENVMRSVPSDGSERPTINSVMIVSKAQATGIFDHATLDSDYEYIAPGAAMTITASGVDAGGYPAEIPAGITWQLSDSTMGTIADGVFTAGQTLGDVTAQLVLDGAVVGEMLLHVVNPDSFGFNADSTVVPYGKSAELVVEGVYGSDSWAVCLNGAYTLTLSDDTAAVLNGNVLTAPADEAVAGVDVTATYLPDPSMTDVIAVSFGKGSEILFDFEDGDVSDWMGFQDAKQWSIDNGVNNTLVGSSPLGGQFNEQIGSTTFLSSEEMGGKVKNGQYALAWSLDNTDADFAGWSYNVLFYVGEHMALRDTANGKNATTLGMWLYIPENAAGLAFQSQLYNETVGCKQSHFTFTTASGAVKNLNSCTEADIPESRWVYASIDLTAYDYLGTPYPEDTSSSRSPSIVRTYVKPTEPAVITFYIDDITLDYSSAVEDRVLPTISNVSYATGDTSVTLEEGAVISGNEISFSANVADNAGLNTATGDILVDGISTKATVSGSVLSCGDVKLNPGVHTVSFEIQDKLGNLAKVTRTFTIEGESVVTLSGHNDSGAAAEYDSVYYADINVAAIENIDSLTTTIYLQTANTWEPQGIAAAEGFEAEYSHNEITNELTVTVKRVGETDLTGAQTLVSLPIRVWSWDGVNNVTGEAIAPETHFKGGYCPIVQIRYDVVYGEVNFVQDSDALNAFGGTMTVDTNLNDNVNPWHYHDAELTVLNQDATCTTGGYTDRTYCETCQSVVDWGTATPASGHSYQIVEEQLVCDCGEIVTGSGIVTANGKLYCLIVGKIVTGWQAVGTSWCYADPSTLEVKTGEFTVSGLTYTADEGGIVIKGAWVTDENGTQYSYGPACYKRTWAEIDGATYYFGEDCYMYTGWRSIPVNRNNLKEGIYWYEFAEDGKYVRQITDYTGFLTENGKIYYVVDGANYYGGLMLIDGNYYYARTYGELVVSSTYWITKTNDLLPEANYSFDAEGKMIDPPVTEEPDPEEPEVKNGIVEEDGKLWWYVDGLKVYGGLMLIDGNYYYARSSGEILTNCTYWITKTNDLLPAASYTFGEDGKMIDPPATEEPDPEEPKVKNGIVEENGKLWWYVDGVKTYGGLMLIDGDYYYARSSGEILTNCTYWITKTNDLLPAASYTFGADGKMIDPPTA